MTYNEAIRMIRRRLETGIIVREDFTWTFKAEKATQLEMIAEALNGWMNEDGSASIPEAVNVALVVEGNITPSLDEETIEEVKTWIERSEAPGKFGIGIKMSAKKQREFFGYALFGRKSIKLNETGITASILVAYGQDYAGIDLTWEEIAKRSFINEKVEM